jgi:hypothetical protein
MKNKYFNSKKNIRLIEHGILFFLRDYYYLEWISNTVDLIGTTSSLKRVVIGLVIR